MTLEELKRRWIGRKVRANETLDKPPEYTIVRIWISENDGDVVAWIEEVWESGHRHGGHMRATTPEALDRKFHAASQPVVTEHGRTISW